MSSVQSYIKEPTSLRRQFTVYPDFTAGQNQYFTVNNGILYRTQADLSGVDYIVARDMGKEMTITDIDPSILDTWFDGLASNIKVVRKGTARKFQVLSMVKGNFPTSNLYFTNDINTTAANSAGNGTAFGDDEHSNGLYETDGNGVAINDLLIVGSDSTVTTSTTQTLPFGTFWAVNDPIVISYIFSDVKKHRAIKNRIDETTLF
jgi:hypothetical protein